jgi:flotillin
MNVQVVATAIAVGSLVVIVLGMLLLVQRFYRRVPPGTALVVTRAGQPIVAKSGLMVFPVINSAEPIDLTAKVIRVQRTGRDALLTNDDVRVDLDVSFTIRVEETTDGILKVASTFGCAKVSDPAALDSHFRPTFASALATVVQSLSFDELAAQREKVQDHLLVVVSDSLGGFVLDTVAIERVERTASDAAGPFR